MPLCKWHTFRKAPCLICCFIVILFYIEGKWLLMRNLATILPLKSKLSGKFQYFNAIDINVEMLKNSWFPKISIKMKNCKTFYEAQTASPFEEIIKPPITPQSHQLKSYYVFGIKEFFERYTKVFRNLLQVLQECSSWASRKVAMQMFFLTTNKKIFAGKILQWETFLAVLLEHIIFNVKCVELRKISEIFWAKLYCNMSDLFR